MREGMSTPAEGGWRCVCAALTGHLSTPHNSVMPTRWLSHFTDGQTESLGSAVIVSCLKAVREILAQVCPASPPVLFRPSAPEVSVLPAPAGVLGMQGPLGLLS